MSYNRELALVVKAKDQVLSARDETGRTDPVAGRRAWVLGTVIALVALTVGSVFGDRGILNLMHKRQEVDELRVELHAVGTPAHTTNDIVATLGRLVGGEAISTYEDEDGDADDEMDRSPRRRSPLYLPGNEVGGTDSEHQGRAGNSGCPGCGPDPRRIDGSHRRFSPTGPWGRAGKWR